MLFAEVGDVHIILKNSSMIPIYEQLVDQVKNEIISGALKENEALPSVRALSGELRISALTVKKLMTGWRKRDLLLPYTEKAAM